MSKKKPKSFLDYLLPSDLVANSKLGVEFTSADAFRCIGTSNEHWKCKRDGRCHCGRFINSPFLTRDRAKNVIECVSSERAQRSAKFSSTRQVVMADAEIQVQSARADRATARADRLEVAATEAVATKKELASVKTLLDLKLSRFTTNQHKQQEVHDLKEQVGSLKRSLHAMKASAEALVSACQRAEQSETETKKKLKKVERELRDLKQAKDGPVSGEELKRLGLSRRSMIDVNWHKNFR